MDEVGQIERKTQNRIVTLFRDQLQYVYLGNWEDRSGNSNIEENLLRKYLTRTGYTTTLIDRAFHRLRIAANNLQRSLYENNRQVYDYLRYGVNVKEHPGENDERVHLIDWKHPLNNDFSIAEEVTVLGNRVKRPDIVLYINGIAVCVLELKRSTVAIGEGIRQSITNQQKEFIQSFFSTIQLVMAGNDTEGLRYGTIGTPEKYFLNWKEDVADTSQLQLDKYLTKLCGKERLIELLYDFILFDGGIKKLPRHHQYFGVKTAQEFVRRKEGGIIWHTQGSGKSIVMVLLARWILENNPRARIAVITDRDELDKQIQRVFTDAGEQIYRTTSGRDLMQQLGKATPRMLCSLVHKFGRRDVEEFEQFIEELQQSPTQTVGELFIFVDECHRTQSGKLHRIMKAMLKNAIFIGFTGTPLLRDDKKTSHEVFGRYIHTYKFNEGVSDQVVLDLVYEARDIDQRIVSQEKIDAWFESKTKGLNDHQKSELKKRWGTLQKVLSSKTRLDVIAGDIVLDFNTKARLSSSRGNAILVAGSIYEAVRFYDRFQQTELKGKCAVITSYNPTAKDITTEDTGANTETDKEYIYKSYLSLLNGKKTEQYEDEAKKAFISDPLNMRLLIVVDKLLTGFDAPPCSYLYIDKSMQDHGLFQAICRVNRLDGEDKQFGYIVDYKDLFESVQGAISVYTSALDYTDFKKEDVDILLKERLKSGRERLDDALEEIAMLCEPVPAPKDTLAYIRYFCGNPELPEELKKTEERRTALYRHTVAVVRAYANIADDMESAGYTSSQIIKIKKEVDHYVKLRDEIKITSGEYLDLKSYEADMRHLLDTYIQAEASRRIDPFGDQSLLDVIVNSGIGKAIDGLPNGLRTSKEAIAETIENNVRKKIIKDFLVDPAYFEKMSQLLDTVIKERKAKAIQYEEYLKRIAEIAQQVIHTHQQNVPAEITTPAQRALYNNLENDTSMALKVHEEVLRVKKADFIGNQQKENEIKGAIYQVLKNEEQVERIFEIIKQQQEYRS